MKPFVIPDLEPLVVSLDRISHLPGNPRRGDVESVAASLKEFGQHKPIVVRRTGKNQNGEDVGIALAGNHTFDGALLLEWDGIAVVWVDDDELRGNARALADNNASDKGTTDDEALAAMLSLVAADPKLLAATAYTDADLAKLLKDAAPKSDESEDEDAVPEVPADPIAKRGDVWLLGPHRILCGDCRDFDDVDLLLGDEKINLAFTSPPYASQRKYDESSGFKPIPPGQYVEWFDDVQANVKKHLADDGSWFINIKPASNGERDTDLYVFDLVIAHAREWGWHFATEFCWERVGVPTGVKYRFKNQFEPVYQFALDWWKIRPKNVMHESDSVPINGGKGVGTTTWADRQGNKDFFDGRGQQAGMAYPGNRLPSFSSSHQSSGHTAAFPVGLPEWFVKAYTDEGDNVYDPFMGSGSTLLAAHKQNRVAFGCEISPGYVDVICRRFQELSGEKPVLESTGQPHDFTTA